MEPAPRLGATLQHSNSATIICLHPQSVPLQRVPDKAELSSSAGRSHHEEVEQVLNFHVACEVQHALEKKGT